MSDRKQLAYSQALQDFRHARERATLEIILDRLQGQPTDLLSYEEARLRLHAHSTSPRGLHEIPLDSIIGSVGRYSDFTRSFLPRDKSAEQRWAQVKALAEGLKGFPPIEVYQLGEAYFVRDGHHRVSVARDLGAKSIEAYVTEVKARVSLSPGDDPSQLIIKEEYTEFLEQTELDRIRPGADIVLTEPGKYPLIKMQIDSHHRYLQNQSEEPIDYERAVGDWYDRVYLPVVDVIRRQGIMREFPDRTESDLYLWVMDHRADLEQHLGWDVGTDQAAADLAEHHSQRPARRAGKLGNWLLRMIVPDTLESGPPAGDWRRQVVARRQEAQLFRDVLVAVRDDEKSWQALEQALAVAERERSRILGLHVAHAGQKLENQEIGRLADRFHERLEGEA
ncbi:MAG: universal stress protein, partial [Anaerolineales bacterium]